MFDLSAPLYCPVQICLVKMRGNEERLSNLVKTSRTSHTAPTDRPAKQKVFAFYQHYTSTKQTSWFSLGSADPGETRVKSESRLAACLLRPLYPDASTRPKATYALRSLSSEGTPASELFTA